MPTFTLTDMETRIVLAGLAELPLKISLPVVRKIEQQAGPDLIAEDNRKQEEDAK